MKKKEKELTQQQKELNRKQKSVYEVVKRNQK